MMSQKVQIEVLYIPLWYASVQKIIAFYLPNHATLPNKVIIYSNAWKQILKLVEKFENYLDGDNKFEEIYILTLVGTQTRAEKAAKIKQFVNGSETSGTNMNKRRNQLQRRQSNVQSQLSPIIADLSQEYGRAGRRDDATPDCVSSCNLFGIVFV